MKKTQKKSVKKIETAVAVITEKEIAEPLKKQNKLSIPKTWISEKQLIQLVGRTPAKHIYTRPGKGGQTWTYVTGSYVEKVLNFTFGWNWDFKVVTHGKEGDQIWVHGELTVKDDKGHQITKSQFGRADIKFKKDTKIMLDFGNDLKAATTDALKKCASLLGIASDIYGKNEFKDVGVPVAREQAPAKSTKVVPVVQLEEHICHGLRKSGCGNDITPQDAEFSRKVYGKELCRSCQAEAKSTR